jgi:hypothetical protein
MLPSCGFKKVEQNITVVEEVVPEPLPEPSVESQVKAIVSEENEYRLGLGETMLSEGLSCTLYTVSGGTRIQSSIPGHTTLVGVTKVATFLHRSVFNQANSSVNEGMNVLPLALRTIYKSMYKLTCTGYIVVVESGFYNFELASDDASLLYLNGSKVIDNDNAHAITSVQGQRYLRKGVHQLRLDYAQTGGSQALMLKANGDFIDGLFYVH